MATAIALPRQPHSWLDRLRTIGLGIGARGAVGHGLARQRGVAADVPWWLPTGITAGGCLGAWQSVDVGSYATSLLDLNGTGKNLIEYGGSETPGWSSAGWAFNGTTQRLRTGVDNSLVKSMFVRIKANAYGGCPAGGNGGSGSYRCYFWVYSVSIMAFGYGGYVSPSGLSLGVYYSVALSQRRSFKNGVYVAQTGAGTVMLCNIDIGHRPMDNNGAVYIPFNGVITHAALYSATLSDAQQAQLHANAST